MSEEVSNHSLFRVKSIVFEALPILILIVLNKEKTTNHRKPMLAAYRIVEEITKDYFNCFDQINSQTDKKLDFRAIEKLLRPRIYDIMKDLVEFDPKDIRDSVEEEDQANKRPKYLGYVKKINMEYEITEKGKEALKEYVSLIGNFFNPFSASISNIGNDQSE